MFLKIEWLNSCISCVRIKPVSANSGQVRQKQACTVTNGAYHFEISGLRIQEIVLSLKWKQRHNLAMQWLISCSVSLFLHM